MNESKIKHGCQIIHHTPPSKMIMPNYDGVLEPFKTKYVLKPERNDKPLGQISTSLLMHYLLSTHISIAYGNMLNTQRRLSTIYFLDFVNYRDFFKNFHGLSDTEEGDSFMNLARYLAANPEYKAVVAGSRHRCFFDTGIVTDDQIDTALNLLPSVGKPTVKIIKQFSDKLTIKDIIG
jgi:hypothetical protein